MKKELKLYRCMKRFWTKFGTGCIEDEYYLCEESRLGLFYFIYTTGGTYHMCMYKERFERYFENANRVLEGSGGYESI